jgi:carboxylesterase type B
MGESAGGSSILHHITANGGSSAPAFNRAILQSPVFLPQYIKPLEKLMRYDDNHMNSQFESFAASAGCSSATLSCLRGLTSDQLQAANQVETKKAPYGHFQYGPSIDGAYVQHLPGQELLAGHFSTDIQIMVGHNRSEFP